MANALVGKLQNAKLFKNIFFNFIQQFITYLIPLMTIPFLYRVVGIEKLGLIAFIQSFNLYFLILTDFGFNNSATRLISDHRNNKEKISEIFSNVIFSKILLLIVCFLLLIVAIFSIDKFQFHSIDYFIAFMAIVGNVIFPLWLFQGLEEMKYITYINGFFRIATTIPIFFIVKVPADYTYAIIFNSLGYLLIGLFGFVFAIRKYMISIKVPTIKEIASTLKESSTFFFASASVIIYTASNTVILGFVGGDIAAGIYNASEKIYTAVKYLYMPINTALYPYMIRTRNLKLFKTIFTSINLTNILLLIICIFGAPYFLNILYPNITNESIQVFQVLSVSSFVIVPSIFIGYPLLGVSGFVKYVNYTVMIGSIFHVSLIILCYFLGRINPINVSIILILTETLIFLMRGRKALVILKNPHLYFK